MDHTNHSDVISALSEAQKADKDQRDQARESASFVTDRRGQWEQDRWDASDGKPRYTFDQTNPIIDQVAGTIERSDFGIDVAPAGGDASIDVAETYSGLIRNIQNASGAQHTYNRAGRGMIISGLDGWMVDTQYTEGDSFDQDLAIKKISGFIDRVWFGHHEEPDASDAECAWLLTGITPKEFKEKYPEAPEESVETDVTKNLHYFREDLVVVGDYFYLQPVQRDLVLFSNGQVFPAEKAEIAKQQLAPMGFTEVRRRTRTVKVLKRRKFSGRDWLEDARDTVFENWLPIIPCYGNFKVIQDKRTYWGVVEKLMDAQRVYNYAMSRQIEEGALAPRAKWLATEKQIEGHEEEWAAMNTSADPFLLYNTDESAVPPDQKGGAVINSGLKTLSDDMAGVISMAAGMFAANMGEAATGQQSGVAIEALQDRGDTGTNKYLEALECSMRQTCRILIDAMPRVYQPRRQVRVLGEDGTRDFVTLGQEVTDPRTGEPVVLNDLSQGVYDVTVQAGPSYKNRQNETVAVLKELAASDPTIAEIGGDILAQNVSTPGMKDIAERKRRQLFVAGLIPESQLTDEERAEQQQQAQQPPPEDPSMVLAQAELQKAMADQAEVQRKAQESQQEHQLKLGDLQLKAQDQEIRRAELQIEAAKAGVDIKLKGAQALKAVAEAEAQEIENSEVVKTIAGMAGMGNG